MDKWLKRIWFVNGILVLIAASFAISDRIQAFFPSRTYRPTGPIVGEQASALRKDSLAIQDIVTTIPRRIGLSSYSYVALISKDLQRTIDIRGFMEAQSNVEPRFLQVRIVTEEEERSSIGSSGAINIAFVKDDGSDTRLLTMQKACIVQADIPPKGDTLQKYILYRIVFHDTDGDGRLTNRDQSALYISDLSGHNLRAVTPDSVVVRELVKSFRRGKLVFRGQVRPMESSRPVEDWPEQIYTYDVQTSRLAPLLPDENVLALARRILWTR